MTDYLTLIEVLAIHADQIEGGSFTFDALAGWLREHVVLPA